MFLVRFTGGDNVERFGQQGAEIVASESAPFVEFLRRDLDKWQKLFAQLGIRPE